MATEEKDKGVEVTGTSVNPSLEGSPSTVDLSNTPLRDETPSVSRHEYNDDMSAIKAQMSEMTQLLRALMSKAPEGGNAVITPNIQTLGGGESVSQFRDDSRNGTLSFPFMGMERVSIPRLPLPRAIPLYLFPSLILHMQDKHLSLTKMSILYGHTV